MAEVIRPGEGENQPERKNHFEVLINSGLSPKEILAGLYAIADSQITMIMAKGRLTPEEDRNLKKLILIKGGIKSVLTNPDQIVQEKTFEAAMVGLRDIDIPEGYFLPETMHQILGHIAQSEDIDIETARHEIGEEIKKDNEADFWKEAERRQAQKSESKKTDGL